MIFYRMTFLGGGGTQLEKVWETLIYGNKLSNSRPTTKDFFVIVGLFV